MISSSSRLRVGAFYFNFDRMLIVITGPESSGKTTLGKVLADRLNLPFRAEFAREYLSSKSSYNASDIENIGQTQELQDKSLTSAILDTDSSVLKIWYEHRYKNNSPILDNYWGNYDFANRVYLLCYPDIPWEYDPLREHRELNQRITLFKKYEKLLSSVNARWHIIKGQRQQRIQTALHYCEKYFL